MTDLTIEQHLSNLGAFIDDAEHFELADDSVVDVTEAVAAFHAISAEIASLRASLNAASGALCGAAAAVAMNEHPAIENLRTNQTQLDEDGCMVAVSRQAVEETLAEIARLRAELAAHYALCLAEGKQREELLTRVSAALAATRQDAERMREALRPFVEFISAYPRPRISVSAEDTIMMSTKHGKLTLAHFDEARAALHGATAAEEST